MFLIVIWITLLSCSLCAFDGGGSVDVKQSLTGTFIPESGFEVNYNTLFNERDDKERRMLNIITNNEYEADNRRRDIYSPRTNKASHVQENRTSYPVDKNIKVKPQVVTHTSYQKDPTKNLLKKLDTEIRELSGSISQLADVNFDETKQSNIQVNGRALSYGVTVFGGHVLTSLASTVAATTFDQSFFLNQIATISYGWAFSGFFFLEGQLDDPEPDCDGSDFKMIKRKYWELFKLDTVYHNILHATSYPGAAAYGKPHTSSYASQVIDVYDVLHPTYFPDYLQQRVNTFEADVNTILSCALAPNSDIYAKFQLLLTSMRSRLEITQNILDQKRTLNPYINDDSVFY